MHDQIIPAIPFPPSLISDEAPPSNCTAFDAKDALPMRASAAPGNVIEQKGGFHLSSQRTYSLRWLDVATPSPDPSTPVRFPSVASAITTASSLYHPEDSYSTGDTVTEYDGVLPPQVHSPSRSSDYYMAHQRVPSLAASQRSVLRLVARPFSRKKSADLPSLDSVSLPSSPITPTTPIFASGPSFTDFTHGFEFDSGSSPFLDVGLHSGIEQGIPHLNQSIDIGERPYGEQSKATPRPRRKSRVLHPESEQEAVPFNASAPPTLQQLQHAQNMNVFDQEGIKVRFGDLWRNHPTCVIFIRHFWCPLCMDYMRSLTEQADPEMLGAAGVRLVVISNGSPAMIKSYKKIFKFPYPLYTDPSCAVYHALGMTLRTIDGGLDSERGDYIGHGTAGGIAMIMKNAVKARMPIHKNGGDIKQLGGEFVLGPGLRCSYVSRMHNTRSHAPVQDVLSAAGVQLDFQMVPGEVQPRTPFDAEEQWMRDRDAEMKRIQARKGKRRGFMGEHRRSESSDFDTESFGTLDPWPVGQHPEISESRVGEF